jgi:hypothetical protein
MALRRGYARCHGPAFYGHGEFNTDAASGWSSLPSGVLRSGGGSIFSRNVCNAGRSSA